MAKTRSLLSNAFTVRFAVATIVNSTAVRRA